MRFATLLLTATLCAGSAQAQDIAAVPANPEARVPAFHGTTLSGEDVVLPGALKGKVAVLVMGFSTGSRDAVTAWGKLLAGNYHDTAGVLFYEMPVIASIPRILRGLVAGKIKDSVPPPAQPHCVLVEADEAKWKQTMQFAGAGADEAYVAVVDETGVVRWRTRGTPTDSVYAVLRRQIEALQPAH